MGNLQEASHALAVAEQQWTLMGQNVNAYIFKLERTLALDAMQKVPVLARALLDGWQARQCVYLCGNGGSAANAIHLANDFIYGSGKTNGHGMRAEALSANSAVITCLANDLGYDRIYSEQIKVKANPNDILIALSGSGDSPNIIKAIEVGNSIGMKTFAILGFNGGRCKEIAQYPIHFEINDMQIIEDIQLIIGHMCMQWLSRQTLSVVT